MRTLLLSLLLVSACDDGGVDPVDEPVVDPESDASWGAAPEGYDFEATALRPRPQAWDTCGDPVCSGWRDKGLPSCGTYEAGDRCPRWAAGKQCDPVNDCNQLLQCDYTDPTGGGNCPISLAKHKTGISYLRPAEVEALARDVHDLKLATWVYRADPTGSVRTGFLIDDVPGSPAVAPDGEHVDLYGYTSMAVAAIQAQAAQIERMEKEIAALREEVRRARK